MTILIVLQKLAMFEVPAVAPGYTGTTAAWTGLFCYLISRVLCNVRRQRSPKVLHEDLVSLFRLRE